jgi:hypothetical protein|tara:strand:+ start:277 stop:429 length:153 start_codon:yes stop_codon:yes gene_type:complete
MMNKRTSLIEIIVISILSEDVRAALYSQKSGRSECGSLIFPDIKPFMTTK